MFSEFDRLAMTRALTLAEKGLETTYPNPRVGCVIAKDGHIIAEGGHEHAGEPHAEVMALRAATARVEGATAYVTLEPCSHHGRTPPCTQALIEARLGRLVFAVQDPNPSVSGQGAAELIQAGMSVESGLLEAEATELNIGFLKRMKQGLPWVRLKLAMSLDGRTALANGASQWITSDASRHDVQLWRARSSAVLTGIGTILADDPRLNVRLGGAQRWQPLRVVLDSELRCPPEAGLFAGAAQAGGEVVIFTVALAEVDPLRGAFPARWEALTAQGARIEDLPAENGMLNLASVLERLAELEMNEILVEAGPTLAGRLLAGHFADELLLYVAPKLLGPQGRPLVDLPELQAMEEALGFALFEVMQIGEDMRLRLRPTG